MKFSELQQFLEENLGINHLADIARELGVSPQAVSNWKSRDRVPYKYVIQVREKFGDGKNNNSDRTQNIDYKKIINIKSNHIEQRKTGHVAPSTQISTNPFLEEEDTISLEDILLILIKSIKIIILLPIIFSFITFIYSMVSYDPIYTSTAKILLEGNQESRLGGIAAQFGINVPEKSSDLTSTSIFPELISSRPFAERILVREFYTEKFKKNLSLLSILINRDNEPNIGKDTLITEAARILPKMITFGYSGSFTLLSVKTFEPQLAADMANAVLEELVELNRYFKNKKVIETKEFIEDRILTVKSELEEMEEEIKNFRLSNRNYESSPTLLLKINRLSRNAEIHTGMYNTLKQELELIKIEEVQAKYLIQILEHPIPPLNPSNSVIDKTIIYSIFLGLFLALGFAFFKNYFYNLKKNDSKNIGLIKGEFKNNLINILVDRNVYVLVTAFLLSGLPFLFNHKSVFPVYFSRYSTKALIIIILYNFICILSLLAIFNFEKIKSYINKVYYKFLQSF